MTRKIIRKNQRCDICGIIVQGMFNLNRHKKNQHAQNRKLDGKKWKKSLASKWIQEQL